MSDILKELETGEELSAEYILIQLLEKKRKVFHTEIHNPVATSGLDLLTYALADFKCDDVLKVWLRWFRTNMVAYRRKRAEEIVRGVSNLNQAEAQRKSLKEILLGR